MSTALAGSCVNLESSSLLQRTLHQIEFRFCAFLRIVLSGQLPSAVQLGDLFYLDLLSRLEGHARI